MLRNLWRCRWWLALWPALFGASVMAGLAMKGG